MFTSILENGVERTVDEALNSNLNRRISVDLSQFQRIVGVSPSKFSLDPSIFFQKRLLIGGTNEGEYSITNPYSYLVIKFTDSKSLKRFYRFTYTPSQNTGLYTFKGSEPSDNDVAWCLDNASGVEGGTIPGSLEQTNNVSKFFFASLVLAGSRKLNVEVTEFETTTVTNTNFQQTIGFTAGQYPAGTITGFVNRAENSFTFCGPPAQSLMYFPARAIVSIP